MINKVQLQSIIDKYYLDGKIEQVKWEIKDNKLNINFSSPNKEMLGSTQANNFNLQDLTFGVNNTTQLLKLLNITAGNLELNFSKQDHIVSKLIISDENYTLNYSLANILIIPKAGKYTGSEEYDIEAPLNLEILNFLIKANSSLQDNKTVCIKSYSNMDGDFQLELVFGEDDEYSNKVSFYLTNITSNKNTSEFNLKFDAELFKAILACNKDLNKGKLFLNTEGLIKLEFENEITKNIYYLVQKQN